MITLTDTPGIQKTFARNVERYRKLHGLSKFQLAADAGIDSKTLYAIESGRHNATLVTVERLARALCVPANALLSPEPPPVRFELSALQNDFDAMPPAAQAQLLAVIRAFLRVPPDL